jgi:hypothetical protein
MPELFQQEKDKSFASSQYLVHRHRKSGFEGDVASKIEVEAAEAFRRFRGSYTERPQADWLRPTMGQNELRQFAVAQGVDFDALVEGAAQHFMSPVVQHRMEPLSGEELEFLFEDDQRAVGG